MMEVQKRIIPFILTLTLLLAAGQQPTAAQTAAIPAAQAAPPAGLSTPEELEAFIDGLMAAHLQAHNIAGATVAVVKDGELFFAKGYGYADLEERRAVEAETTLFRIGSTTKMFTWTAVMQLVEAGILDLDTDVNAYLTDLQVPATYPEPVTMAHLMAHTAGFEERFIGLFARSPEEIRPLEEILAKELPARIRPPGEMAAYSNHAVALAGHIVAELSGLPWEAYVEQHVTQPLAMPRTTPYQPVPDPLAPDVAKGYVFRDGRFQERGFEYIPLAPAGSISATAVDMANFMIAHLQDGRFGDGHILQPEIAQQMAQTHFQHDPRLPGMAHGFIESNYYGLRTIGHGGDTFLFHTGMELIPTHNSGIFVSYNSEEGALARDELIRAFVERYFVTPDFPPPPAGPDEQRERFAGAYRSSRSAETTMDKIADLLQSLSVRQDDQGYLIGNLGGAITRLVEVEPLFFREADGPQFALLQENDRGEVERLFIGNFPVVAFVPMAWYEAPSFHLALQTALILLFLSALLIWPIAAWRRRRDQKPAWRSGIAGWLAGAAALLLVIYVLGFAVALSDPFELAFHIPPLLRAVTVLPLLAVLLALGAGYYGVLAWRESAWTLPGRVHYTLVVLAVFIFIWWLSYWNLLIQPLIG